MSESVNEIIAIANQAQTTADSVGQMSEKIAASVQTVAQSIGVAAEGMAAFGAAVSGAIGGAAASIAALGSAVGVGLVTAAAALPAVGESFVQLGVSLLAATQYIPQLIMFGVALGVLALMGDGLNAAGAGLLWVAEAVALMTATIPAAIQNINLLATGISFTGQTLLSLLCLVLIAASFLVLSLAMKSANDQIVPFNNSLSQMKELLSTGFVVQTGIFALLMAGLALVAGKTASGIDKITSAMGRQAAKLKVLLPLLAAQAVLSNPIMGAITVGLAVASAAIMATVVPAMAKGGIVDSPTVALVGEGRYPEAVIPLGDSPQFRDMKSDIVASVLNGINGGGGGSAEIVLNMDGRELARRLVNHLNGEYRRRGYVGIGV